MIRRLLMQFAWAISMQAFRFGHWMERVSDRLAPPLTDTWKYDTQYMGALVFDELDDDPIVWDNGRYVYIDD